MTEEQLKELILKTLGTVAPDVDLASVDPDVKFRDQFDFDSMDFLNFIIGLHKALEVDIGEVDYPKLGTLNGGIAYLQQALSQRAKSSPN
jgi:acyl carrier protein